MSDHSSADRATLPFHTTAQHSGTVAINAPMTAVVRRAADSGCWLWPSTETIRCPRCRAAAAFACGHVVEARDHKPGSSGMRAGIDMTATSSLPQRMSGEFASACCASPFSATSVASSGCRARSALASADMSGVAGVSNRTKASSELLIGYRAEILGARPDTFAPRPEAELLLS